MGLLDGIIGGIGNIFAGEAERKGYKNAGNAAMEQITAGREALLGSDLNTVYAPAGRKAFQTQQDLLGLGEDPAAAQAAFDNYLGSTGYRTALKGGNDAITSSMAAGLGNKSGAADKARLRFGTGLGQQYFDNYFNQVGGIADRGYDASKSVAQGVQGSYDQAAQTKWNQYAGAGQATSDMYNNVFGSVGYGMGSSGMGGGTGGGYGGTAKGILKGLPTTYPG